MPDEKREAIKGACSFHTETGTEGGYWAFQDSRFISADGQWSYEGMYILRDGDRLTIYRPDKPREAVWSGIISLRKYPPFTEDAFGYWIHSDQNGVHREMWAMFFIHEYPADLVPMPRE